jgi:glycosyltransferase involved in cell wall biosynthesis
LPFGEPADVDHTGLVSAVCGGSQAPVVWLYTPMALPLAQALAPELLVYDVMDDLASFRGAPAQMRLQHMQALAGADVVFTGGRSLHERVLNVHQQPARTLCLPSGVEAEHFRRPRRPHDPPVAGYVGVIDERLDLDMIARTAALLPDWRIRMVGPVIKIEESALPVAPNIEYLGKQPYAALPDIMAGFDVALMPFALNEATAAISPTKTLEYLAAGLPVVSTRVRDVVRDHGEVVMLADSADDVAAACRRARSGAAAPPGGAVARLLAEQSWDSIVARMEASISAVDADTGDGVARATA